MLEAGSGVPLVAYPDEIVSDAVARMLRSGVGRLPVVSRQDSGCPVGYLGRAEVIGARRGQLEEEDVRERTWRGWAARRSP